MSDRREKNLPIESKALTCVNDYFFGSEEIPSTSVDLHQKFTDLGFALWTLDVSEAEKEDTEVKVFEEGSPIEVGDRLLVSGYIMFDFDGKPYLNIGKYPYSENESLRISLNNLLDSEYENVGIKSLVGMRVALVVNIADIHQEYTNEMVYDGNAEPFLILYPELSLGEKIENINPKLIEELQGHTKLRKNIGELKAEIRKEVSSKFYRQARNSIAVLRRLPLTNIDVEYLFSQREKLPPEERPVWIGDGTIAHRLDSLLTNTDNGSAMVESLDEPELLWLAKKALNPDKNMPAQDRMFIAYFFSKIFEKGNFAKATISDLYMGAYIETLLSYKLYSKFDYREEEDLKYLDVLSNILGEGSPDIFSKLTELFFTTCDEYFAFKDQALSRKYLRLLTVLSSHMEKFKESLGKKNPFENENGERLKEIIRRFRNITFVDEQIPQLLKSLYSIYFD